LEYFIVSSITKLRAYIYVIDLKIVIYKKNRERMPGPLRTET